jgi:MFS family permease
MALPPSGSATEPIVDPGAQSGTTLGASTIPASAPKDLKPVSKRFIGVYTLTMFGFNFTMLMPTLFGLAYAIQVIRPEGKETSLGLVVGIGAIVNIALSPVAGVLSDRTRTRWGRRRPWLASGVLLSAGAAVVMGTSDSIAVLGAGYCFAQLGVVATMAAVTPVLADQIPQVQRGLVGAFSGISTQLAGVAATLAGSILTGNLLMLFLAPVVVLAVGALLFFLTIPDPVPAGTGTDADARGPITSVFRELLFDPRQHKDYTLVWLGRLMMQAGVTFFSTYQLYFLLDRLGFTPEDAGKRLAMIGGIGIVVTMSFAMLGGLMSDRIHRRKPFIYLASGLVTTGLVIMAFTQSFGLYAVGTMFVLAASGLFGSVDLAFASDVVPDKTQAGRWMSILNVAGFLPSVVAPVIAPAILSIGGGGNYTALFLTGAIIATGAGLTASRVRSVR